MVIQRFEALSGRMTILVLRLKPLLLAEIYDSER